MQQHWIEPDGFVRKNTLRARHFLGESFHTVGESVWFIDPSQKTHVCSYYESRAGRNADFRSKLQGRGVDSCHTVPRRTAGQFQWILGGGGTDRSSALCDEWRSARWHESTRVTSHIWGTGNSDVSFGVQGEVTAQWQHTVDTTVCLGSFAPTGPTFGPWRKARECPHTIGWLLLEDMTMQEQIPSHILHIKDKWHISTCRPSYMIHD